MPEIGVRELKARASEIVRDVRDRRARYIVTYRGRPVGILLPLSGASPLNPSEEDPWDKLVHLGKVISDGWPSPLSASEVLSEMRR